MISVIIPACNEEAYINDCIKAVKQCNSCEIIVVCNGCTDKTLEIAKKKVNKVLNFKERNIAKARNAGVKVSSGDILVFLDADTLISNAVLENIKKNVKFNSVGTCKFKPNNKKLKHRLFYFLKNNFVCPFGVSNGIVFCDRKTFDMIGGFDESLSKREDGKFVRTIKKNGMFILLNEKVINSTRRFDKFGYFGVIKYWIKEALKPTQKEYEIIR